jgi:signal transduction histidine kinase
MAGSGQNALRTRWRHLSLRARLTALAMAVLAVALVSGVLLLIAAQSHSLTSNLDAGARRTAAQVSSYVTSGDPLPDPLPIGDGNTVVVQLINADGQVVGASATADRLVPLLSAAERGQVRDGDVLVVSGNRAGVNGTLRVVGQATGLGNTTETVIVAVYADQVNESVRALRDALFIAAPVLLLVASLVCWHIVGRALRPVEDLRRGAEEITGSSRQLPVPQARDEIRRLAETLNDMLARLDAASARQRGFIADAAHELRSPLASLRTQLEVAARLGAGADWPTTVEGSLTDIDRLSRLVDDLLLLARLDERPSSPRRQPVEVWPLVAGLVETYDAARVPVVVDPSAACVPLPFRRPNGETATESDGGSVADPARPASASVSARSASATVPAGPARAVVLADPDAIRRIVRNLLDNAVRHAAATVSIGVLTSGGVVTLTVSDDGPGIAPADRVRVFDRFTRLDAARSRDAGGSGLGLAIVRELVHSLGGSVALEDARPGRANPGLRVVVRLPAA